MSLDDELSSCSFEIRGATRIDQAEYCEEDALPGEEYCGEHAAAVKMLAAYLATLCDECDGSGCILNYERDGRDVYDKCDACDGTGKVKEA